jgi:peptidase inhibitor family I36
MIDVITASPRSLRRKTIAFMAAALLSATAFMVVSPGQASATYGVCGARDFCLHYSYGQSGGVYHFSGSDSNLDNDHFEGGASNLTVGGNAESAWNNGRASTSGHDDAIVYTGRNWTGGAGCIRLGQRGDLAGGFVNNVHSYRWVTPATCNRYRTALAPRRG